MSVGRQITVSITWLGIVAMFVGLALLATAEEVLFDISVYENSKHFLEPVPLLILAGGAFLLLLGALLGKSLSPVLFALTSVGIASLVIGQKIMDSNRWLPGTVLVGVGLLVVVVGQWRSRGPHHEPVYSQALLTLLVVLITGLGFFLRLYLLHEYPQSDLSDEALNTNFIYDYYSGRPFEGTVQAKEFLYFQLGSIWSSVFEPSRTSLRYLTAILGGLSVFVMYFLGQRLFSAPVGLFTALVLAVSPWHTVTSRVVERQNLAILMMILTYLLWLSGLQRGSILIIMLAGLVTGLGFHTWVTFKIVILVIGLMVTYQVVSEQTKRWRILIGVMLAAILFSSILVGPFYLTKDWRRVRFAITGEIGRGKAADNWANIEKNAKHILFAFFGRPVGDSYYNQAYGLEPGYIIALFFAGIGCALVSRQRFASWITLFLIAAHTLPPLLSDYPFQRRMQGLMLPVSLLAGLAMTGLVRASGFSGRNLKALSIGALIGLGFIGQAFTLKIVTSMTGERDRLDQRVDHAPHDVTVVLERDQFQDDFIKVAGFERCRDPFSFFWLPIKDSLPLLVRNDRPAMLFVKEPLADETVSKVEEIYPGALVEREFDTRNKPVGAIITLAREQLVQAYDPEFHAAAWQPGTSIAWHGAYYLPIDLRPYAQKWGHSNAWNLNLDWPYFKNDGFLKVSDMAAGLIGVEQVPFHVLPGSAIAMDSILSQDRVRLYRTFTITLPYPVPASRIHFLGLTSFNTEEKVKPSTMLSAFSDDGSVQEIKLFSIGFRLEARPKRRMPYPTKMVTELRNTFIDYASFTLDPLRPVRVLQFDDMNSMESLLFLGITLELDSGGDEESVVADQSGAASGPETGGACESERPN